MQVSRKKIAIIGGGVGAITAAYAITQLPNWQDEYDITLYQLGWRLGGKGASGRNPKKGDRIEEHGLHIWAGFYDNGFRLMRDCYEQLNKTGLRSPGAPLGTLEKAFTGLNHFLLAEEVPNANGEKELHPWRVDFEEREGEQPGTGKMVPSPFEFFRSFLDFVIPELDRILNEAGHTGEHRLPARLHIPLRLRSVDAKHRTPLHALHQYSKSLSENALDHSATHQATMSDLARHAQGWFHGAELDKKVTSDRSRRMHIMISLSTAFFRGAMDNDVFRDGFDAIDNWEISEWLLHYGAEREAVYSAVFRGCYDYVFGYPGGVMDSRSVGAGTAIRGLLRLAFCYKGALFYKMNAGMGDTIFGPYYQLLRHRGVKFKFFNAATNLRLDSSRNGIAAIDMVEQARVKEGKEYEPLKDVRGLPCWPSEPFWDQLENADKPESDRVDFECERDAPQGRSYTLKRGEDFDLVVLGASIGSLHYMTPELAQASTRWRGMLEKVQTVATHAAQFWMDTTPEQLGWNALVAAHNEGDQRDLRTVMTSAPEPLDTWADMSDLIGRENWPDPPPQSIAYFCSPAHDDGESKGTMAERTKLWADETLVRIWPGSKDENGAFDTSLLHDTGDESGDVKFANQYFRENLFGSERYVMSIPGSVQYRLPPDGSGFENLYLAGDWTRCGINAGCVEAATISGLACARGLTGADIEIVGEGDLANDAGPTDAAKLDSPYAQTAPWPLTPMFGTGQIDGFFSFHAVDSEALEMVLPEGMSLHPQTLTPEGTHPVTVLCNQQMGVRASVMPRLLAIPNYYEAIVAINFVQVEEQEGAFTYLPNLSLTNRLAELSGIIFYGYNKTIGKLSMGHNGYNVAGPNGATIYSGHYNQRGFARPLTDFPTAGRIEALLEQVVVSRGKLSKWQYSSFDFNLSSAYVAGIHAKIDVQDAKLANLPKGVMYADPIRPDGHPANPDNRLPGAFRIWTSWTLSNPLDSGRLVKLARKRALLPRATGKP
ncbi:MAG: NAD(P)-binding protein [Roseovarius sp.]